MEKISPMEKKSFSECNPIKQSYEDAYAQYIADSSDQNKENVSNIQKTADGAEKLIELGKKNPYDFYSVLGVEKSADKNEIKKAVKRLSVTIHPDKTKDFKINTTDAFQYIQNIGEVLAGDETTPRKDKLPRNYYNKNYSIIKWFVPNSENWVLNSDSPQIRTSDIMPLASYMRFNHKECENTDPHFENHKEAREWFDNVSAEFKIQQRLRGCKFPMRGHSSAKNNADLMISFIILVFLITFFFYFRKLRQRR